MFHLLVGLGHSISNPCPAVENFSKRFNKVHGETFQCGHCRHYPQSDDDSDTTASSNDENESQLRANETLKD